MLKAFTTSLTAAVLTITTILPAQAATIVSKNSNDPYFIDVQKNSENRVFYRLCEKQDTARCTFLGDEDGYTASAVEAYYSSQKQKSGRLVILDVGLIAAGVVVGAAVGAVGGFLAGLSSWVGTGVTPAGAVGAFIAFPATAIVVSATLLNPMKPLKKAKPMSEEALSPNAVIEVTADIRVYSQELEKLLREEIGTSELNTEAGILFQSTLQ